MRVWTNSRAGALGSCMSSLPIKALISRGQARGLAPSTLFVTAALVLLTTSASSVKTAVTDKLEAASPVDRACRD